MELYCFFCAARLKRRETTQRWGCPGCGASFEAEEDKDGCVLRLEVSGCGTPDCCRQKPLA